MPVTRETILWVLLVAVGLPAVLVAVTEVLTRLRRAGHPAAGTLRVIQLLVVPAVGVYFFLVKVAGLPTDHTAVLVTETLAWVAGLVGVLSLVNDVVFGAAKPDTWRARVPTLFRDISRLVLVAIGAAIIYSYVWGKSLEGAVTALGVTSIVLGLALQEPLGNMVSGLMLLFERPINLNDWVTVDGTTGKVVEINWRSVHIQTFTEGVRIVPNSELYKKSFNNLSRPTDKRTEAVEIGLSYRHPPNEVKDILLRMLTETPGVLADPAPLVRTVSYADSAVVYRLIFTAATTADLFATRDEVMSRVWYVTRRHRLEIPYPTATQIELSAADLEKLDPTPRPLDQLVALPAFRTLCDGPLDEHLEAGVQAVAFATGEVIVREGARVEGLHVVIGGAARLTVRGPDGTDREVERLAVGNYFGEGAVLGGQASDVTVTAESDLRLVVVSPDALYRMLGKLPPLSRQLGDLIDVRRRAANAARRIRTTAQSAGT